MIYYYYCSYYYWIKGSDICWWENGKRERGRERLQYADKKKERRDGSTRVESGGKAKCPKQYESDNLSKNNKGKEKNWKE